MMQGLDERERQASLKLFFEKPQRLDSLTPAIDCAGDFECPFGPNDARAILERHQFLVLLGRRLETALKRRRDAGVPEKYSVPTTRMCLSVNRAVRVLKKDLGAPTPRASYNPFRDSDTAAADSVVSKSSAPAGPAFPEESDAARHTHYATGSAVGVSSGQGSVNLPVREHDDGRLKTTVAKKQSGVPSVVHDSGKEYGDGRKQTTVARKQSGVTGVVHDCISNCWKVIWMEKGKLKTEYFRTSKYRTSKQCTKEQAEAAGLQAAIAFRKDKEKSGTIKIKNTYHVAGKKSGFKGVYWRKRCKCWFAEIRVRGISIAGGCFIPASDSEEDIERARLLAVDARMKLERKHIVLVTGK